MAPDARVSFEGLKGPVCVVAATRGSPDWILRLRGMKALLHNSVANANAWHLYLSVKDQERNNDGDWHQAQP
jgi:hypothetical protein